jgi:hypothetical protein
VKHVKILHVFYLLSFGRTKNARKVSETSPATPLHNFVGNNCAKSCLGRHNVFWKRRFLVLYNIYISFAFTLSEASSVPSTGAWAIWNTSLVARCWFVATYLILSALLLVVHFLLFITNISWNELSIFVKHIQSRHAILNCLRNKWYFVGCDTQHRTY